MENLPAPPPAGGRQSSRNRLPDFLSIPMLVGLPHALCSMPGVALCQVTLFQILRPFMGRFTKIFDPTVKPPCFQVGVGRAPETEVRDAADPAAFMEYGLLGGQGPDPGDQVPPGLLQRPPAEIIDTVGVPEGGAEVKEAPAEIFLSVLRVSAVKSSYRLYPCNPCNPCQKTLLAFLIFPMS